MRQIARLFQNGRSQAVRLKYSKIGDMILSCKPDTWDSFLASLKDLDVPTDFLDRQERQTPIQDRDPHAGWSE